MTDRSTAMDDGGTTKDILRQVATVVVAIANPLTSQLPQLTGTGRTIAEQAEATATLLVPWDPAFAIWGLIFLGLLAYAVIQALPRNRMRPAFRAFGWHIAAAMGLSALWALAASYLPLGISAWATAVIFTPYAILAAAGMVIASRHRDALRGAERWLVAVPIGLFAGWVSLAVFINWEQVFANQLGLPEIPVALVLLGAALAFVAWHLRRAGGPWAYAAAALWGLSLLAYDRLVAEGGAPVVGIAALAGVGILLSVTIAARRARSGR